MAKRGRPKKLTDEDRTTHLRVKEDLAEMIRLICRLQNVPIANFLDPLLRPQISARYAALKPAIEAIEKAEAAARQAAEGEPKRRKGQG